MVVFSERMLPEVMDVFWGALARGETVTDAAKEVGTYHEKGGRWIAACGGASRDIVSILNRDLASAQAH